MKTTTLALILFLTGLDLWAQMPPPPGLPPGVLRQRQSQSRPDAATNNLATPSSGAGMTPPVTPTAAVTPPPVAPEKVTNNAAAPEKEKEVPYVFDFEGVDVNQVLDVYADMVGRTLIRGNVPPAAITLKTQSPLTKTEAIEALQAVLAINGISVVNIGEKFAKVGTSADAGGFGAKPDTTAAANLPEMGSYITHIVQLKNVLPSKMLPIIQPLGRLKDIIPLDDNGVLVIRDYAENVKRMLEMIEKVDVNVPAVYISEVIPIKYALADDIANALSSLGGSGNATVAIGNSTAAPRVSGLGAQSPGTTGFPGTGGTTYPPGQTGVNTPNSTLGQSRFGPQATTTTPGSTLGGGANTFQARLQRIINQASGPAAGGGQQPIEVFGQAKIIADERSNSLLVFATRQDMDMIKEVIAKLDVLLSQVLIESAIIDYSLGPNTLNFGVSASQDKQTYASNPQTVGLGGINNGQTFLGLLGAGINGITNTGTPFGNSLPGGLSYFGNIGPKWDVALQAAAADQHATIVQRPSIMTSQARPAQFFVGDTVPYVTGNTYGSAYGNTASYSQLSVGVELDVTPFINPDGLVVMDIQQEIDALNGTTHIDNVGDIPNTIKRTLTSEIAVNDRDTIMLGGFIENDKSTGRAGVPVLMDIPLLGNLFTSRHDSKKREELVVLMRPTVLKTPELAAAQAIKEQQRLPGVTAAEAEDAAEQRKEIKAEQKAEASRTRLQGQGNSFFTPVPPNAPVPMPTETPAVPPATDNVAP